MTRHKIQVLREAGHSQREVAQLTGVGERSVRRVECEPPVEGLDEVTDTALRRRSRIGRPSKVEGFRKWVESLLEREPEVPTLEALRRAREDGFEGGKSAFYAMVAELRPPPTPKPMVRFEGVAGEFTQHDFGQVCVLAGSPLPPRVLIPDAALHHERRRGTYANQRARPRVPQEPAGTRALEGRAGAAGPSAAGGQRQ